MNIQFRRAHVDEFAVLCVEGNLDSMTCDRVLMATDDVAADGHTVLILDLGGVDLIDSTGVTCLVMAKKRFQRLGGNVYLTNNSETTERVLGLLHLEGTLEVIHSLDELREREAVRAGV
jgi:anti-anti-sigma factor